MKRLILTLTAAAALAGPMLSGPALAQPRYDDRDRYERYDRYDRYDRDRYERRDDRPYDRRDWNDRRYNGYYLHDRWYWGPPPRNLYGNRGLHLGWRNWQRGTYLPPYYRGLVIYDYGRYGLHRPPRGYHWVRVNDDYILAAIATGLIREIIRR